MARKLYSQCELVQKKVEELVAMGWTVSQRGKHYVIRTGRITLGIPRVPGDHRAGLNWLSQLKRAIDKANQQ